MDKKDVLEKKIVVLSNKLREEKPTIYEHLTESPQTLPNKENEEEFIKALEKYEKHLENLLNS
jgi:ubiquinone biosynthesis protein UbiJ